MDSPIEPVSPAESSGSDTPPEEQPTQSQEPSWIASSLSKVGFGSKRRLPSGGGSFGSAASSRDTKSRRREDAHGSRKPFGFPGGSFLLGPDSLASGERATRVGQKEELVDTQVVEALRRRMFQSFNALYQH